MKFLDEVGLTYLVEKIKEDVNKKVNIEDLESHLGDIASEEGRHGIRYWQELLEVKVSGEWIEIKTGGGGSSVKLGNVLDLAIEAQLSKIIKISWRDSSDVVLEGITLAEWGGTQLRRKESTYPVDEKDGDLIVDNKTRDTYSEGYLDEGLVGGTKYYYALFPYSTSRQFTVDVANRVETTAFEKYTQEAPVKPTVSEIALLKATVSSDVGSVVSLDKETWHSSPHEFTGLVDRQTYTPYAKFKETEDKWDSPVKEGDSFEAINKKPQSAPSKPVVSGIKLLKATVTSALGSVVSLNNMDWYDSPHEFIDLTEGETYTPYAKFEETELLVESDTVEGEAFKSINKTTQVAPSAPSVSKLDFDRATVAGASGTEVRIDSGTWYDSPHEFTDLTEETSYTAYARMKETSTKLPSESSVGKSFTTESEQQIYGFEIDETNTNPKTAVTYIGDAVGMTPASGNNGTFNWGSWEPFIKEISKPIVVKAGVEQYDLDYEDYTKKATSGASVLTGADGDVFTKLKHIYMKHTKISKGHKWELSTKPFAGAKSMTAQLENQYNQLSNPILITLQNLFLLIFKDRDSQTALGRGRVDGAGYIASGNTNNKGFMFGSTSDVQMKFLGIEDFWGNKFQWIDGLMTDSNWDLLLGDKDFNDTGSGYTKQTTNITTNTSGYFNSVQGGKGGYTVADKAGSETTGYADQGTLYSGRIARFGGARSSGSQAGAFILQLTNSAGNSPAGISARLCFKNTEAVYIGAYLGYEQGSKLRSISGNMPTDTKTISQFRTLAQANN